MKLSLSAKDARRQPINAQATISHGSTKHVTSPWRTSELLNELRKNEEVLRHRYHLRL